MKWNVRPTILLILALSIVIIAEINGPNPQYYRKDIRNKILSKAQYYDIVREKDYPVDRKNYVFSELLQTELNSIYRDLKELDLHFQTKKDSPEPPLIPATSIWETLEVLGIIIDRNEELIANSVFKNETNIRILKTGFEFAERSKFFTDEQLIIIEPVIDSLELQQNDDLVEDIMFKEAIEHYGSIFEKHPITAGGYQNTQPLGVVGESGIKIDIKEYHL